MGPTSLAAHIAVQVAFVDKMSIKLYVVQSKT